MLVKMLQLTTFILGIGLCEKVKYLEFLKFRWNSKSYFSENCYRLISLKDSFSRFMSMSKSKMRTSYK